MHINPSGAGETPALTCNRTATSDPRTRSEPRSAKPSGGARVEFVSGSVSCPCEGPSPLEVGGIMPVRRAAGRPVRKIAGIRLAGTVRGGNRTRTARVVARVRRQSASSVATTRRGSSEERSSTEAASAASIIGRSPRFTAAGKIFVSVPDAPAAIRLIDK